MFNTSTGIKAPSLDSNSDLEKLVVIFIPQKYIFLFGLLGYICTRATHRNMSKFKGTQSKLERKYVGKVCIGIGTIGAYSQITANSILPETDNEYLNEREEIEANMQLYSKAPEMLEMLENIVKLEPIICIGGAIGEQWMGEQEALSTMMEEAKQLIKEATELELLTK